MWESSVRVPLQARGNYESDGLQINNKSNSYTCFQLQTTSNVKMREFIVVSIYGVHMYACVHACASTTMKLYKHVIQKFPSDYFNFNFDFNLTRCHIIINFACYFMLYLIIILDNYPSMYIHIYTQLYTKIEP